MVFCVNVSDTLIAVSNVSCFCWHQEAEAGELIVWLGNTRHTHMGLNIWRRCCGCSSVCIIFLDGAEEGGSDGKEWLHLSQWILEESVCSQKGKLFCSNECRFPTYCCCRGVLVSAGTELGFSAPATRELKFYLKLP